MRDNEIQLPGLLAVSVAALLVMTALMMHALPRDLAMILVSWAILSVPVGVSFGHCVLSEP